MATQKRRVRVSADEAAAQWKTFSGAGYMAKRGKLIERLRGMSKADYSPTPTAKELKRVALMAESLALWLEGDGLAQSELELKMHELHGDAKESEDTNYKGVTWRVREIAEAARDAAAAMPDPRKKYVVPFAATSLVSLWREYGFPRPVVNVTSPAVIELAEVLTLASPGTAFPAEEALRNEIANALRQL